LSLLDVSLWDVIADLPVGFGCSKD
jgi:hypothetical protein